MEVHRWDEVLLIQVPGSVYVIVGPRVQKLMDEWRLTTTESLFVLTKDRKESFRGILFQDSSVESLRNPLSLTWGNPQESRGGLGGAVRGRSDGRVRTGQT